MQLYRKLPTLLLETNFRSSVKAFGNHAKLDQYQQRQAENQKQLKSLDSTLLLQDKFCSRAVHNPYLNFVEL